MSRILAVTLLLVALITGTGCYIPAIGGRLPNRDALLSIEPGVTTRAEVLHWFGRPNVLESGRYLAFHMEKGPAHFLIAAGYNGAFVPAGKTRINRLLFEFDSTGVVTRWYHERADGYLLGYSSRVSPTADHDSLAPAAEFKHLPDSARVLPGPDWFAAVAVSPDGAVLAAADTDGRLWLRNLTTGVTKTLQEPKAYDPLSRVAPTLQFNGGGDRLAVLARGVQVVDPSIPAHIEIPEGLAKAILRAQREAEAIALTQDGMTVARGDDKGWVRVRSQGVEIPAFRAHKHKVVSLAFSPDGALLATAGEEQFVRVWNTESWLVSAELRGEARAVQFSPDGSWLAVLLDTHVELWSAEGLQVAEGSASKNLGPSRAFLLPYDSSVDPTSNKPWPRRASLVFSSDSRLLAAAVGSAIIYDTIKQRVIWRYLPRSVNRDDAIAGISFTPDGRRAAMATKKGIYMTAGDWAGAATR